MAEEAKPSGLDAALDTLAEFFQGLLTPENGHKKTFFQKWFSIHEWVDRAGTWMISRGFFLIGVFIPLWLVVHEMMPEAPRLALSWLLLALPVALPVGLGTGMWKVWVWYAQAHYIFTKVKPVLLEIKMPTEITKSPRAMELVLTSFWIRSGTTTFIDRNWYGGGNPYASLELVSFGGEIHFYIWVREGYRNVIESAMYSQYPEVEIVQVEDYATKFHYDPKIHWCWATDYKYEPRGDEYPIKTYVDFELDKDPKEEHKVEPYASVLEVLSALNKDEQIWIQIVLRGYFSKPTSAGSWQVKVLKEVDKIRDAASQGIMLGVEGGDEGEQPLGFPRPTKMQQEQMQNMERNLGKLIFDVGMRGIYIAPAGKGRSAEFSAFRWIWRPFNNPNFLNGLRPRGAHNDFDYLWQDWKGVRWNLVARRYFDAFRRRQFFHSPWITPTYNMSTEILATLWHPPSRTIQTPGLQRIAVTKSEAPPNLPM